MASWSEARCSCCGELLAAPLARLGALYCQDCRHAADPQTPPAARAGPPRWGALALDTAAFLLATAVLVLAALETDSPELVIVAATMLAYLNLRLALGLVRHGG